MIIDSSIKTDIVQQIQNAPFVQHIGLDFTEIKTGYVAADIPFNTAFTQQYGVLHGGLIASVMDSVAGFAAVTMTEKGQNIVTAELKVSFLRGGSGNKFCAVGKVLKAGKSLYFCEGEMWNESKLIAKASATFAVR